MLVRNEKQRIFIGEVLDLYKMAVGNHYGSVKTTRRVAKLKYLSVHIYLPLQSTVSVLQQHYYLCSSWFNGLITGDGDGDISIAVDTEAPLFSCCHHT